MVVIRFQRLGTKKTPHHRIVVTDRRRAQASRVLETIGYYDPSTQPPRFSVDESRVAYWRSVGAQTSEAVQRLLKTKKAKPVT
jgi:small subunit ribosomal protein S16